MLASIMDWAWCGTKLALYSALLFLGIVLVAVTIIRFRIARYRRTVKKEQLGDPNVLLISFFHPFWYRTRKLTWPIAMTWVAGRRSCTR